MAGCVACISLQLARDDFKIIDPVNGNIRYILPPWAVAEEVYAWSKNVGMLLRLKDEAVEDPRYNRNTLTKEFRVDEEYPGAVAQILAELDEFRQHSRFEQVKQEARRAQFRNLYTPTDH